MLSNSKHSPDKARAIDSRKKDKHKLFDFLRGKPLPEPTKAEAIQENLDAITAAKEVIAKAKKKLRKLGYKADKKPYVELTPAACDVSHLQKMHTHCDENTHLGNPSHLNLRGCYKIYQKMRQISHETGEFYLSIAQISKAVGYSESQTKRLLHRLKETGWAELREKGYGFKNGYVNKANKWHPFSHDEWAFMYPGFCSIKVDQKSEITQEISERNPQNAGTEQVNTHGFTHGPISGHARPDISSSTAQDQVMHGLTSVHVRATNLDSNPEGNFEEKSDVSIEQTTTTTFSEESVTAFPPEPVAIAPSTPEKKNTNNQHSDIPISSVPARLKVASNEISPEIQDAITSMVKASGVRVAFNKKEKRDLIPLIEKYGKDKITRTFNKFLQDQDDFSIRFASKNFVEKAEDLLIGLDELIDEFQAEQDLGKRLMAEDVAKAQIENAEILRKIAAGEMEDE